MGTQPPSPKGWGGGAPQSSFHVYCGQTAGWTKMVVNTEIGLSPGDCVTWGPSPHMQKGAEPPPQISAHFYCGQTSGCTKVPLGTELGFNPGTLYGWGPSHPLSKRGEAEPPPQSSVHVYRGQTAGWIKMALSKRPTIFGHFYCYQAAGCIKMPSWYAGRLQPRRLCARWDRAPSPKGADPPIFGRLMAKRLHRMRSRCHLVRR